MELLLRGSVRDPAAKDVVVSAVRMTDDLSIARVYVRVLEEIGPERQEAVVSALDRATGFLRRGRRARRARRAPAPPDGGGGGQLRPGQNKL